MRFYYDDRGRYRHADGRYARDDWITRWIDVIFESDNYYRNNPSHRRRHPEMSDLQVCITSAKSMISLLKMRVDALEEKLNEENPDCTSDSRPDDA